MQNDLISRSKLLAHLEDWRNKWEETEESYEKAWILPAIDFFTNLVKGSAVAYDVDKVVAELEELKEDVAGWIDDDVYLGEYKAYKRAIDIVRNGGKE